MRSMQIIRIAALIIVLFLAGCAAAPARLVLSDDHEVLDRALVAQAAAPLLSRGATVAVIVAAQSDASGDDVTRRLGAAGLLVNDQIAPGVLAIYVSYTPRYSELRAGTRWSEMLPDSTLRTIRMSLLNPALRDATPTAGVVATLESLEVALASPPLIERIWHAIGLVVVAGFILVGLVISPLGEQLGRWWSRSPPGRLVQWLVDQT
ncbi:MAG: hypothetical protein HGA65_10720, partial [Oscillochloris sp.]|nr:hypothetical protein [Oscillochloris sp.]